MKFDFFDRVSYKISPSGPLIMLSCDFRLFRKQERIISEAKIGQGRI